MRRTILSGARKSLAKACSAFALAALKACFGASVIVDTKSTGRPSLRLSRSPFPVSAGAGFGLFGAAISFGGLSRQAAVEFGFAGGEPIPDMECWDVAFGGSVIHRAELPAAILGDQRRADQQVFTQGEVSASRPPLPLVGLSDMRKGHPSLGKPRLRLAMLPFHDDNLLPASRALPRPETPPPSLASAFPLLAKLSAYVASMSRGVAALVWKALVINGCMLQHVAPEK